MSGSGAGSGHISGSGSWPGFISGSGSGPGFIPGSGSGSGSGSSIDGSGSGSGSFSDLFFLDLGPHRNVFSNVDDGTRVIRLPSSFYFGQQIFNTSYISSNGLLSFGTSFSSFSPSPFPLTSAVVIAPFWDDIRLTNTGIAEYGIVTSANTSDIIDEVETFLELNQNVELELNWVLVAKWVNVCPYGNSNCAQTNTFQVVIASQGTTSYAIFTYKCNLLRWTTNNSVIGYSAGREYFENHPLSRTSRVTDIDCLNYPSSVWSNIVYKLNGPGSGSGSGSEPGLISESGSGSGLIPEPGSGSGSGSSIDISLEGSVLPTVLPSSTLSSPETVSISPSLSSSEEPSLSTELSSFTFLPTPSPAPDLCTDVLPYISLTNPMCLRSSEFSSRQINPKRGIKTGATTHTSLFVNYNGVISLSRRFLFYQPSLFPSLNPLLRSSYVFAPLWNFYDITVSGNVCYQVFDNDNITDQPTLDEVSHFIQKKHNVSFNGVWMIVVEWRNIHAYPHSFVTSFSNLFTNATKSQLNKTNTFEAIIITDHVSSTYVIYTYKCGDLEWDTFYYTSIIGYNVPGFGFTNHPLSGRRNDISGTLDCSNRKCSFFNIVYYFNNDKDASQRCLEAKQNDVLLHGSSFPLILSRFSFAQTCPCQLNFLLFFDFRWFFIGYESPNIICYANYRFGISGVCCYNETLGFIINEGSSASRVALYNPFIFPTSYAEFDEKFRDLCCIASALCDVYHSRRPRLLCYNVSPFFFSWNFGDPHITTMDGRSYTFNGLGEYVMTRITGHFELQARTALATGNTTNSTATIFSVVAMGGHGRDSELKETVQVEIGKDNKLVVLINGSDISANLTTVNSTIRYDSVFLKRVADDTVRVVFSNDVAVNVTLRVGLLSFVILVPQTLLNNTVVNGLLGNIDGDTTNEFVYRNGTKLSDDTTDRILHTFGQSWQITEDESLFYYPKGLSVANFSVPDHKPQFLDELDNVTRKEAEDVCGGPQNIQCIFDYSQTGNRELAQNTQRTLDENEENQRIANNSAPLIKAAEEFIVTINSTSIFIMNITDPGDTFNVTIEGNLPAGYTFENLESIYTLSIALSSIIEDLTITVIAKDSLGATSAIQPQVRICGCFNEGNCTLDGVINTSSNPLIFLCECNEAFDGRFCENDADGCSEISCFNNADCIDNKAPSVGGTCPACPSGYSGDGSACIDIDECANMTLASLCSQRCINNIGSYECQCNSGYELAGDNHTCNDIDECSRFLHDCQQICVNTLGSYNCSCNDGFILQNDTQSCVVDSDRKCPNNNKCEQLCVLDVGSSSKEMCSCYSGFVLDSNSLNCTDINECNASTNPCEQRCINNYGSFNCKCNTGYTLNTDGLTCKDIDECFQAFMNGESLCPSNQICQNIPGRFSCSCPAGSQLQNSLCVVDVAFSSTLSSLIKTPSTMSIVFSTSSPTPTLSEKGLSNFVIAGIAVGSFIGLLMIALLIFILVFIIFKQYTKKQKHSFLKNNGTKDDDFTIKNIYYEPHSSKLQGQTEIQSQAKLEVGSFKEVYL